MSHQNLRYFVPEVTRFSGIVDADICNRSAGLRVLNFSSNKFNGDLPMGLGNCQSSVHCTSIQTTSQVACQVIFSAYVTWNSYISTKTDFPVCWMRGLEDFQSWLILMSQSMNSLVYSLMFSSILRIWSSYSVSSNYLDDQLPKSLSSSSKLQHLDLRNNALSGPINLNCKKMIRLIILDLGISHFEGQFPDDLLLCGERTSVNMDGNRLHGQIPEPFHFPTIILLIFLRPYKSFSSVEIWPFLFLL